MKKLCIVLSCLVAVLAGCKGKPPRPVNINWQPATLATLDKAKGEATPCMILLTDGTPQCDKAIDTWLARPELEQGAQRFCAMKVNFAKTDDPLVKKIMEWGFKDQVKKFPTILFIRSNGIPGQLVPGGRTVGEIKMKMIETQ